MLNSFIIIGFCLKCFFFVAFVRAVANIMKITTTIQFFEFPSLYRQLANNLKSRKQQQQPHLVLSDVLKQFSFEFVNVFLLFFLFRILSIKNSNYEIHARNRKHIFFFNIFNNIGLLIKQRKKSSIDVKLSM